MGSRLDPYPTPQAIDVAHIKWQAVPKKAFQDQGNRAGLCPLPIPISPNVEMKLQKQGAGGTEYFLMEVFRSGAAAVGKKFPLQLSGSVEK
jgi:hypothetical protein